MTDHTRDPLAPPPPDPRLLALANQMLVEERRAICRALGIPEDTSCGDVEGACRYAVREMERLQRWAYRIEGGDAPCNDADRLREWAYQAMMGQGCPEDPS